VESSTVLKHAGDNAFMVKMTIVASFRDSEGG
jgi:hypothetical protein